MKKRNASKRALLLSTLSLLLCLSMLVGSTFAWFTDSVTSKNNLIQSGNLDVELYFQAEGQTDWTKVTDTTNIFTENALWEPGYTEVVKFKIVNEGSLALKYRLGVNVVSETGSVDMSDNPFMLSDFIKFGIVDGNQAYTREQAVNAAEDNGATALKTAYNSTVTELLPKVDDTTAEDVYTDVVTMVVYMPSTVGNEANHKTGVAAPTITLGINLVATQFTYEKDSFDELYDENATFPGTGNTPGGDVEAPEDAIAQIKGTDGNVQFVDDLADLVAATEDGGVITLLQDVTLTETFVFDKDIQATFDMNGKTVSGELTTLVDIRDGQIAIKNGSFKNVHAMRPCCGAGCRYQFLCYR